MSQMPIDDAERDRVIAALQRSHASGYLNDAGLKQRVEVALATDDPYRLNSLLTDLPGTNAYLWSPSAHQQVAPFAPQAQRQPLKQWQEFLRTYWGVLVGVALLLLIMMGNGHFSLWWMFIMVAIFFPRGMRSKMHRQSPPAPPFQPNPPTRPAQPSQPQDQFDADDDDNGSDRWNQPPTAPRS